MGISVKYPPPTRDLDTAEEISEMIRRFYGDVTQDSLLGPLFNDVAEVDWSEHLPKLTQFWCRALLGMQGYSGNPFAKHAHIHRQSSFTAKHFHRWLDLFHETVDVGWVGPTARRAKELARNVALVHSGQLLDTPINTDHLESSIGEVRDIRRQEHPARVQR